MRDGWGCVFSGGIFRMKPILDRVMQLLGVGGGRKCWGSGSEGLEDKAVYVTLALLSYDMFNLNTELSYFLVTQWSWYTKYTKPENNKPKSTLSNLSMFWEDSHWQLTIDLVKWVV